jgi:hypothetical protein
MNLGRNAFIALLLFVVFKTSLLLFNLYMSFPTIRGWFDLPKTADFFVVLFVTIGSFAADMILIGFAMFLMVEAYYNWKGEDNNIFNRFKPVAN